MVMIDDLSMSISHSSSLDEEEPHAEVTPSPVVDRETKQVCCMRTTMIVVMSIVTVVISFASFYTIRRREDTQFSSKYLDDAIKVTDSFQFNMDRKIQSADSLSIALTSFANFKNQTWPFVTISDFAVRGATVRSLAEAAAVGLSPIVTNANREYWEAYSISNTEWIDLGLQFEKDSRNQKSSPDATTTVNERRKLNRYNPSTFSSDRQRSRFIQEQNDELWNTSSNIFNFDDNFQKVISESAEFYLPLWQMSPVLPELINFNLLTMDIQAMIETKRPVIGRASDLTKPNEAFHSLAALEDTWVYGQHPVSNLYIPIFDALDKRFLDRQIAASLLIIIFWETYLIDSLPPDSPGVIVVIQNECDQAYTYRVNGGDDVQYLGKGDLHDPIYESMERIVTLDTSRSLRYGQHVEVQPENEYCMYSIRVYPSDDFFDSYHTSQPIVWMVSVIFIFTLTACLLCLYDVTIERRQQLVIEKAAKADDIVASLFPAHVRERLYRENGDNPVRKEGEDNPDDGDLLAAGRAIFGSGIGPAGITSIIGPEPVVKRVASITHGGEPSEDLPVEEAIAELFPNTTVCFIEICGFTPWSSQREPAEVFTLLQTLFQCFDNLAKRLRIFKVETVGESYVAVTGLPEPQQDHAVRMARFARECMHRASHLTRGLEVKLGPDTGDLKLRIGLHSGPVTAGVLKGAKSRFQLFGDTVNTSARMESTAPPDCIQCSNTTADLLVHACKDNWLRERAERVKAKGKGEVQTFFIMPRGNQGDDSSDSDVDDEDAEPFGFVVDMSAHMNEKQRLIDWQVELLSQNLRRITLHRMKYKKNKKGKVKDEAVNFQFKEGSTAIDEVTEVIELPTMKRRSEIEEMANVDTDSVQLDGSVLAQLKDYVTTIASMYRDNSFHNFEHATHVTMSTNKLMKRVASPADTDDMELHEYTYGITSNPLTQFALVFCALIHDVDHAGVSNFQLIKEQAAIAQLYRHRSVAEQNSVDISWDLLMDPNYCDLRKAIYSSEDEMKHFRQLVVNIVLATDIFDKHMKDIREKRWDKAFQYEDEYTEKRTIKRQETREESAERVNIFGHNLKATIVMEHLIQASDVAHTMQHWEIYLKWNERLFQEMTFAFEQGRAPKDPGTVWYEGEIMFFDKYIIPLAKKLAECRVFGVSSDECLNYALQNRTLWAAKGDEIVEGFKKNYNSKENRKKRRSTVTVGSQFS